MADRVVQALVRPPTPMAQAVALVIRLEMQRSRLADLVLPAVLEPVGCCLFLLHLDWQDRAQSLRMGRTVAMVPAQGAVVLAVAL